MKRLLVVMAKLICMHSSVHYLRMPNMLQKSNNSDVVTEGILSGSLNPRLSSAMTRQIAPLFRRATSADIPAMSRIRLSVTENSLSDPTRITAQMYEDYLERSGRGWVAENDGDIVAFCYANKVDASIWALFVHPDHEGRGLGKRLLKQAVEWLFETGHEAIHLTTAAGTRADRFYAAQGWFGKPSGASEVAYSLSKFRAIE